MASMQNRVTNAHLNKDESMEHYFAAFPTDEQMKAALPKSFVINQPMVGVGGDGFWMHDNEDNLYLVAFDCMGHGRMASVMTRIYLSNIKKAILDEALTDPALILNHIHLGIERQSKRKKNNIVGFGADMGIIKLDRQQNNMSYAGAKMDLIVSRKEEVQRYRGNKIQLGEMFDLPHHYTTYQIDLNPEKQSKFYLFSDGVTDLIGGKNDKRLKYSNLKKILHNTYPLTMTQRKKVLENAFTDWMGINTQPDDLLMIGFEV